MIQEAEVQQPLWRKPSRWSTVMRIMENPKAKIGAAILLAFMLLAILAPVIAPYSPTATTFGTQLAPSTSHWLGTTRTGQDILSQLIWGARQPLAIALLTGLAATMVAVVVGILSGLVGGILDDGLMMMTNIVLILPGLVLVIVISSYLSDANNILIAFIIALTSWPWGARVLRAQTITLKNEDFVLASRAIGEGVSYIAFGEILPNMVSLVAANFFFTCLYAVVTSSSLQFLGLGNINTVSWGSMLYWANNSEALMTGSWWWFIPPGLAIGILGAAFALLNFGIDEVTNPRLTTGG